MLPDPSSMATSSECLNKINATPLQQQELEELNYDLKEMDDFHRIYAMNTDLVLKELPHFNHKTATKLAREIKSAQTGLLVMRHLHHLCIYVATLHCEYQRSACYS